MSKVKLRHILIALLIAVFLRAWAVALLPEDFDEPVYLQNGFDYAAQIRSGSLNGVIDYPGNSEHPAFNKLLFAGAVLALGKADSWTNAFYLSRAISAVFGVLAVGLLALLDPLAGGMLALQTLAVKYTSQVYLEALPSAMTIAAVLAFLRVRQEDSKHWLWLSAGGLGIAAASKYSYLPVAIVVLGYLAIFEKKVRWYWLAGYALVALATFFVLDVRLWHDPINRLIGSLTFHIQYSQGAHVQEVGYPWYQPLIWIFTSAPAGWHPNVFFYFGFDGPIAILAVLGLPHEWKTRRWLVIWFAAGLLFLLLWPTKWPQYALILTPALCIMGAETLRRVWKWVRAKEAYWDYLSNLLPAPSKWFWWAIAAFAVFVAAIYLSSAVRLAVGRIGWSHLTAENSFLPSNTINALLPVDGKMLIATNNGAALFTPPATTDEQGSWTILNRKNSGLVDNDVLALAHGPGNANWLGTAQGLSQTADFEGWTTYTTADLGQPNGNVTSLAVTNEGKVYAGTLSGASAWDGRIWTPVPQVQGQAVFALTAAKDGLWIGTAGGAGKLQTDGNGWSFYPTRNAVKRLLVDSQGTVWAATAGSGLARLTGEQWQYFTASTSGLPLNQVDWVEEIEPGRLWLGASLASTVGGELAVFDGNNWTLLTTDNSGASGGEPRAIVRSAGNQVWIGTTGHGIDIYKLGR